MAQGQAVDSLLPPQRICQYTMPTPAAEAAAATAATAARVSCCVGADRSAMVKTIGAAASATGAITAAAARNFRLKSSIDCLLADSLQSGL